MYEIIFKIQYDEVNIEFTLGSFLIFHIAEVDL